MLAVCRTGEDGCGKRRHRNCVCDGGCVSLVMLCLLDTVLAWEEVLGRLELWLLFYVGCICLGGCVFL